MKGCSHQPAGSGCGSESKEANFFAKSPRGLIEHSNGSGGLSMIPKILSEREFDPIPGKGTHLKYPVTNTSSTHEHPCSVPGAGEISNAARIDAIQIQRNESAKKRPGQIL